jgi:hypothetical protein
MPDAMFTVLNVAEVEAALAAAGSRILGQAAVGLEQAGVVVQTNARRNLADHHYTGRAERMTVVSPPLITPESISVTVGIHAGTAPEGRPLEYGWKSESGKQPPTEPILQWLQSSGKGAGLLASAGINVRRNKAGFITGSRAQRVAPNQAAKARSIAFLIARKIGRRGYSFGKLGWLSGGLEEAKPAILGIVGRAIKL